MSELVPVNQYFKLVTLIYLLSGNFDVLIIYFSISVGIVFAQYDAVFKKYHKLSLSILKEFGFGIERVMETRILEEVESLNEELLKLNGRPFDPKWPVTYAASNVVLSILFGKNFLKSHPKDISTIVESGIGFLSSTDFSVEVAPFLRF